jgi:broad specificity phosphatase PhoE
MKTQFLLMRHGEPDYSLIQRFAPKLDAQRFDLVYLAETGVTQVAHQLESIKAFGPEHIVASPYPRCLQSAAIVSRALNTAMSVDLRLHEWMPVVDGKAFVSSAVAAQMAEICWNDDGIAEGAESRSEVKARALMALSEQASYTRVLVVTHHLVIRALTGIEFTPFAGLVPFE